MRRLEGSGVVACLKKAFASRIPNLAAQKARVEDGAPEFVRLRARSKSFPFTLFRIRMTSF